MEPARRARPEADDCEFVPCAQSRQSVVSSTGLGGDVDQPHKVLTCYYACGLRTEDVARQQTNVGGMNCPAWKAHLLPFSPSAQPKAASSHPQCAWQPPA